MRSLLETFPDARNFAYSERWIRQRAVHNLLNQNTAQPLFDAVANGSLTIPVGIFRFGCVASVSAMNATSGNALFDILGSGTATLAGFLWENTAVDNATAQVTTYQTSMMITKATPVAMATAAINTTLQFSCQGSFECTTAGTTIPSITLKDAAAAVLAVGSMFWCRQIGPAAAVSYGNWT